MSIKIEDWLTHVDTPGDLVYLTSVLPPVNMRLFHANQSYRFIILSICDHLITTCLTKMEGYKLPHGVSGANVAIPFNIIAVAKNRGTPLAYAEIMINPVIVEAKGIAESWSNCGSIRLDKPIKVKRSDYIVVRFFDREGVQREREYDMNSGSLTIQHEIDHNNGILITSRQIT